jgi:hypothetical protein
VAAVKEKDITILLCSGGCAAAAATFHCCLSSNAEELSKNTIVTNRTTVPNRFPTDPDPNYLLQLIFSHQNNCITESFVLL